MIDAPVLPAFGNTGNYTEIELACITGEMLANEGPCLMRHVPHTATHGPNCKDAGQKSGSRILQVCVKSNLLLLDNIESLSC